MGKSKSALPDLDKVIELKPDFIAVSTKTAMFVTIEKFFA